MKKLIFNLLTGSLLIPMVLQAGPAQDKGYQIMESIDQKPAIEKMQSENHFKIYDSSNNLVFTKKARSASFVENFRVPKKKLNRSITYFFSPADDKGNSALMIEKKNEDDDQWLYLKGLRKPKRVLGSDKSSSFMGSDFSNGDLSRPDLDDSTYTWLTEERVPFKGKKIKTHKIEVIMKDEQMRKDYETSKAVVWVHAKSGLMFKTDMYDLQNQMKKTMTLLSYKVVKNKDGKKVFIITGLAMKNHLKGTSTIMKVANIKVGKKASKVKNNIFKLQYLTRKWW